MRCSRTLMHETGKVIAALSAQRSVLPWCEQARY